MSKAKHTPLTFRWEAMDFLLKIAGLNKVKYVRKLQHFTSLKSSNFGIYIYILISLLYKASFLETLFRDVVLSTALRPSLITHSDSSLSAIHPSSNWLTKIQTLFGRFKLPIVVDVCFVQSMFSTELWNVCYKMLNQSPFNVVKL